MTSIRRWEPVGPICQPTFLHGLRVRALVASSGGVPWYTALDVPIVVSLFGQYFLLKTTLASLTAEEDCRVHRLARPLFLPEGSKVAVAFGRREGVTFEAEWEITSPVSPREALDWYREHAHAWADFGYAVPEDDPLKLEIEKAREDAERAGLRCVLGVFATKPDVALTETSCQSCGASTPDRGPFGVRVLTERHDGEMWIAPTVLCATCADAIADGKLSYSLRLAKVLCR